MTSAVQPCTRCARANPADGSYCYACGVALANPGRLAVAVGSRPFNSPFVFPSGRSCRSFDELALACQGDWPTACGLLKDGYLESFLGGLGRIDLALAAKEASRYPDPDRGLDQFLTALPTTVLAEPRLRVDPTDVSLGQLDADRPRSFTLELDNQGKRLLYGKVTSAAVWLTLGDAEVSEKAFHFTDEDRVVVNVRADRVRAGGRAVEGKLVVSSNAGVVTVTVRAERPVKAFSGGSLTGAKSPRQIAEKAMAGAKEVAPFFESGEVERWYQANGWVYPVKVPAASGLAAIQQFFEALGLTKPPAVEIDRERIDVTAAPGESVELSVTVSTPEKRPVFAHATSNVPWLEVSRAKLSGKVATVPMTVARVPDRPGEVLRAELTVVSNGNARWVVPVTVEVVEPAFGYAPAPVPEPVPTVVDDPPPRPRRGDPVDAVALAVHALPAVLLALALAALVLCDRIDTDAAAGTGPAAGILGPRYDPAGLADRRPRLGVRYTPEGKFGVVRLDESAPANRAAWKRLTFAEDGATNSTMVKINGREYRFGEVNPDREWAAGAKAIDLKAPYHGRQSVFRFRGDEVDVTQYVQLVPGPTNALDTLLVYYRVRNAGTAPRKVELRLLLDTFIGGNDGVPFLVPGKSEPVRSAELSGRDVPEYLEAIENPQDPKNPGTVVRLGLRNIRWADVDPVEPAEVVIGQMSNNRAWRALGKDITDDSSVAVYWPEKDVRPKEVVGYAITYGVGSLEVSNDLGLTAPGSVMPNREFTVTGYVYRAKAGQAVTLDVPAGLEVVGGAEKEVAADGQARVFWTVRAKREGSYEFSASSRGTRSKPVRVMVRASSIFG
ncbi:MAG: hypothetical protein ACRC33_19355 [Gemmataceae bacterium]